MGQVCQKHNQFYETRCRYCEAPLPGTQDALYWAEVNRQIREPTVPPTLPITISGVLYSPCITSFPNIASYQYNTPACTVWKPHAAGYCGAFCTGIPGVVEPGMRLADPNDGHGSLE